MSRHSRHTQPGSTGVQLGLIITPMLDMSFQILAFFIMTYNPSALEGHIPGSLVPPEENIAKKSKDNNNLTPSDPLLSMDEKELNPELNAAVTVKIRAIMKGDEDKDHPIGSPAQIFVRSSIDTDAELVADKHQGFKEGLKLLDKRLKQMVGAGTGTANLKIAPDGELRQEFVMAVYDACKASGFNNVHFVPPPVLNSKIQGKK